MRATTITGKRTRQATGGERPGGPAGATPTGRAAADYPPQARRSIRLCLNFS